MEIFLVSSLIGVSVYFSKPLSQIGRLHGTSKKKKSRIEKPKAKSLSETREVVNFLILNISAGMTIPKAIATTTKLSDTELSRYLGKAIRSHSLGSSIDQELIQLEQLDRFWKLLIRQLRQSWEHGATIQENLVELSDYLIDLEQAQILKKVRSAGVKSVLPLGLCFLPAFMLVVVVPLIAGLINF
jgi:pilus assembly protein TadC